MTAVDFSPILNELIQIAALILSGVAVWAGVWVKEWIATKTGLQNSELLDSIQQRFNEAVLRSMAYAESVAKEAIPKGGKIEITSPFIHAAATYLVKAWPDLTAGMDDQQVANAIIARLPTGRFTEHAEAITMAKVGAIPPEKGI